MPERQESAEQMRMRVLSYLYGGLSPAEEEAFRADVASNAALARRLDAEQRLDHQFPAGVGPDLPQGAVEESRLLLRDALRQEAGPGANTSESRGGWPGRWLDNLVPRFAWVAGALALFACGLSLGGVMGGPNQQAATVVLPGRLVDVQVRSYDSATGQVQLELSSLTTSPLEGRVDDATVQSVLTAALQGDLEPGPRLQAVALLRRQAGASGVSPALIHALLLDDNPGVRLAAAEALSGQTGDEHVRRALSEALLHDANPGVRVAAVEALRDRRDLDTRDALERSAQSESNEYIRAEANRALATWPTAAATQL